MATPEGIVKQYLRERIAALGGEIRFIKWIGRNHAPDCIVLLHQVPLTLVETKAPGKRPRPGQVREIARLRAFGVRVLVLPTKEDIDREFPHMSLDPRFLTIHPATVAWFGQRKKCERCANCTIVNTAMRCSQLRLTLSRGGYGRTTSGYCIDARLEGAICGPRAALFKEKK